MGTNLPTQAQLDGTSTPFNQGVFKTAVGNLRNFIADLFGVDSGAMRTVHETLRKNGSNTLENLSLVPSVGSNALTMALKTRAGATPSAADPVLAGMRSATAGNGDGNLRAASAATSLVLSSGSTMGHTSGVPGMIYWYLIDSSGTLELAASSYYYGAQGIVATVAEGGAGAADSATAMYSTTQRTGVPFRCIGRSLDTQTAAGTWTAVPSSIELWPFEERSVLQVLPRSYLAGLDMSNNGTATKLDVAAGKCRDSTDTADITITAAITAGLIQTSGSWAAGNTQNKLDTGARANSTWYHVYAIRKDSDGTGEWLFSLSASAPTMPSGYTYFRRIGSVKTDGSGNIWAFVQDGDFFQWATFVNDVTANNPGTSAVLRTLSVPTGVKVIARSIWNLRNVDTGTTCQGYVSDPATTDSTPTITLAQFSDLAGAGTRASNVSMQLDMHTDTSARVRSRVDFSNTNVTWVVLTLGWFDTRGRSA